MDTKKHLRIRDLTPTQRCFAIRTIPCEVKKNAQKKELYSVFCANIDNFSINSAFTYPTTA